MRFNSTKITLTPFLVIFILSFITCIFSGIDCLFNDGENKKLRILLLMIAIIPCLIFIEQVIASYVKKNRAWLLIGELTIAIGLIFFVR